MNLLNFINYFDCKLLNYFSSCALFSDTYGEEYIYHPFYAASTQLQEITTSFFSIDKETFADTDMFMKHKELAM